MISYDKLINRMKCVCIDCYQDLVALAIDFMLAL